MVKNPHRKEDRTRNCQLVIDSLSKEVLETDLSHIQARDIVDCNAISVANLLEIFMGLLEYIFEELRKEEDEDVMKEHGRIYISILPHLLLFITSIKSKSICFVIFHTWLLILIGHI